MEQNENHNHAKQDFLPLYRQLSVCGLKKEFETIPDVLTIQQVVAITGYTDNSVNRWLRQGHLKYVNTQTTKIIAKEWLIDFYCSHAYTITNMSDKHIKLLQKFFKQTGGK